MKRFLSWILVLTLLLSLAACGKKAQEDGEAVTAPPASVEFVSAEQQQEVLANALTKTGAFLQESVAEPTFGSVGGEWLVMGLARSGLEIPGEYFEAYFQNLSAYNIIYKHLISYIPFICIHF